MVAKHVLIYYSASHLSYYIKSAVNLYHWRLQFLNSIIIIKTKVLLPQWENLSFNNIHNIYIYIYCLFQTPRVLRYIVNTWPLTFACGRCSSLNSWICLSYWYDYEVNAWWSKERYAVRSANAFPLFLLSIL